MSKSRIRNALPFAGAVFALAVLGALLAYVFAPRYLPGLLAEAMPPNVHIEHLELRRPGWSSTRIARATLRVEGKAADTLVELVDAALYYRLLDLSLHRARVAHLLVTLPGTAPEEPEADWLVTLAEFRLPDLPDVVFEAEDSVFRRDGDAAQILRLANTRLVVDGEHWRVSSQLQIPQRPIIDLQSNWTSLAGRPDGIEITANLPGMAANASLRLSGLVLATTIASATWALKANVPELTTLGFAAGHDWPFGADTAAHIDAGGTLELARDAAVLGALQIAELALKNASGNLLAPSIYGAVDPGLRPLAEALLHVETVRAGASGPASLRIAWPDARRPEFAWEGALTLAAKGATSEASFATGLLSWADTANAQAIRGLETSGEFRFEFTPAGRFSFGQPAHTVLEAPALLVGGTVQIKDGALALRPGPNSSARFDALRYQSGVATGDPAQWRVSRTEATIAGDLALHFGTSSGTTFGGQLKLRGRTPGETRLIVGDKTSFQTSALDFDMETHWRAPERWPRLRGTLAARNANVADGQMHFATIAATILRGKLLPLDIEAQTLAEGLVIDTGEWRLPIAEARGKTRFDENGIRFDGTTKMARNSPSQTLQASYTIETEQARIDLPQLDLTIADIRPLLAATLGKEVPDLKLSSGKLSGRLALEIVGDTVQGRGKLRIDALMASLADLSINDATVDIDIDSLTPLALRQQIAVPAMRLGSDLDLENLSADMQVNGGSAHLHSLAGRVLQGGVAVSATDFAGTDFGPATLELAAIDMADLFAWIGIKDLSGAGSLNAQLPLRSAAGKLQIRDGSFASAGNGRIRYSGTGGSVLSDNIALRALDDFRFEKLNGTVEYGLDGEYRVKLHILGANPAVYDGFPIALNLDLTGRLPGMLEAALLTGDFSGSIIHQLRTGKLLQKEKK